MAVVQRGTKVQTERTEQTTHAIKVRYEWPQEKITHLIPKTVATHDLLRPVFAEVAQQLEDAGWRMLSGAIEVEGAYSPSEVPNMALLRSRLARWIATEIQNWPNKAAQSLDLQSATDGSYRGSLSLQINDLQASHPSTEGRQPHRRKSIAPSEKIADTGEVTEKIENKLHRENQRSSQFAWEEHLQMLLKQLPNDFPTAQKQVENTVDAALSLVARAIQKQLNEYLLAHPATNLEEKQEQARWVNGQLRRIHLSIRCPKTGRSSTLIAGPTRDDRGRFLFQNEDELGQLARTFTSMEMPTLELIPVNATKYARGKHTAGELQRRSEDTSPARSSQPRK